MRKVLFKTVLVLLISSLYFLVSSLRPAPSLAARCAPKGSPLCLLRQDCPSSSDRASQCCDTLDQCNEPITQVRCAPTGSALCVLRTNCPADSNYSGYCCDNINQCYNTTAKGPETPPGALCGTDNKGVNTAIGCLMAGEPKVFISQLLGWGVGVGGGIAFLMIVLAGFQMVTASGDPKKVQAARELLMSALGGLIIIVLAVVLLNFIGVKILRLNNLGFSL